MSQENRLLSYMRSQERNRTGYADSNSSRLDSPLESELLELVVKELIAKAARIISQEMDLSEDHFPNREVVTSQILEIEAEKIVLKCLIDPEARHFQIRKFDREPLEGAILLQVGTFVEITICTRPGERRYIYRGIDGDFVKHLFEPENLFEEFVDSPLLKPLQAINESDI